MIQSSLLEVLVWLRASAIDKSVSDLLGTMVTDGVLRSMVTCTVTMMLRRLSIMGFYTSFFGQFIKLRVRRNIVKLDAECALCKGCWIDRCSRGHFSCCVTLVVLPVAAKIGWFVKIAQSAPERVD